MGDRDSALMAHLMRRAGFGAPPEEIEARVAKGYEATVEELLHPEDQPDGLNMDVLERYFIDWRDFLASGPAYMAWRMVNSNRPLQEKMTLFWHGILCTANSKLENQLTQKKYFEMLRDCGLGSFKDLLVEVSKDPSMVYYLDNCLSHKDAINENWGRELLELFSMGVGMDGQFNYTEEDVKECSRAFTGWTLANSIPVFPYGRYEARFLYNPDDHDDGEKTFLGETGRFNGEDVIDIIVKQPATARFLSRHLYSFFVADDVQVPSWIEIPPQDPDTIKLLEEEYFRSGYSIRSMLRVLFNSDAFKQARFTKVKSPAETVVGTMRLVGDFQSPRPGFDVVFNEMRYMGQEITNPPSVEGWHTGKEWIDGGTLVERINFVADQVGNVALPGVQAMTDKLRSDGPHISPVHMVERCLEMLGHYELPDDTHEMLVANVAKEGGLRTEDGDFDQRVAQTLQLIVATQEYLMA